jgi:hypothetical protein
MPHYDELWTLTPAERLELVALDLELRRAPRALIAVLWGGGGCPAPFGTFCVPGPSVPSPETRHHADERAEGVGGFVLALEAVHPPPRRGRARLEVNLQHVGREQPSRGVLPHQ